MKKLFLILAFSIANPAVAEDLLGKYVAFIGQDDLVNSNGERLTQAWQILRQDRANYHRFGVSQPGDEGDPFFSSIDNRAAMEQMLMKGVMDPAAERNVIDGGTMVVVRIYGTATAGDRLEVDVVR